MPRSLDDILTDAYGLAVLNGNRDGAVTALKADFARDPAMRTEAKARLDTLSAIVAARKKGEQDGCYISAVACDLLTAALA